MGHKIESSEWEQERIDWGTSQSRKGGLEGDPRDEGVLPHALSPHLGGRRRRPRSGWCSHAAASALPARKPRVLRCGRSRGDSRLAGRNQVEAIDCNNVIMYIK